MLQALNLAPAKAGAPGHRPVGFLVEQSRNLVKQHLLPSLQKNLSTTPGVVTPGTPDLRPADPGRPGLLPRSGSPPAGVCGAAMGCGRARRMPAWCVYTRPPHLPPTKGLPPLDPATVGQSGTVAHKQAKIGQQNGVLSHKRANPGGPKNPPGRRWIPGLTTPASGAAPSTPAAAQPEPSRQPGRPGPMGRVSGVPGVPTPGVFRGLAGSSGVFRAGTCSFWGF